jgi:hypothetical protein
MWEVTALQSCYAYEAPSFPRVSLSCTGFLHSALLTMVHSCPVALLKQIASQATHLSNSNRYVHILEDISRLGIRLESKQVPPIPWRIDPYRETGAGSFTAVGLNVMPHN